MGPFVSYLAFSVSLQYLNSVELLIQGFMTSVRSRSLSASTSPNLETADRRPETNGMRVFTTHYPYRHSRESLTFAGTVLDTYPNDEADYRIG
jgi:hypothetical protein